MSDHYSRRTLLKNTLLGLAALPVSELFISNASAQAASTKVDEKEPLAVSLAYVHDVKKVDASKNPQYKPGQQCANCVQLQGKEGDEWRPCNIFAGRQVNAKGWCKVWALKPGAKVA
jgi:hypothetical protein